MKAVPVVEFVRLKFKMHSLIKRDDKGDKRAKGIN